MEYDTEHWLIDPIIEKSRLKHGDLNFDYSQSINGIHIIKYINPQRSND